MNRQTNNKTQDQPFKRGDLIDFEYMQESQRKLTGMFIEMWRLHNPRSVVHLNISGIMLQGDTFVRVPRCRTDMRPSHGDLKVDMSWPLAVKLLHRYRDRPMVFSEVLGMILRERSTPDKV